MFCGARPRPSLRASVLPSGTSLCVTRSDSRSGQLGRRQTDISPNPGVLAESLVSSGSRTDQSFRRRLSHSATVEILLTMGHLGYALRCQNVLLAADVGAHWAQSALSRPTGRSRSRPHPGAFERCWQVNGLDAAAGWHPAGAAAGRGPAGLAEPGSAQSALRLTTADERP